MEFLSMTIQLKAVLSYGAAVFIMLYKVVLTFEILKQCDHLKHEHCTFL